MSLLDDALATESAKRATDALPEDEVLALAIAVIHGSCDVRQAATAMRTSTQNVRNRLFSSLRRGVVNGVLTVKARE